MMKGLSKKTRGFSRKRKRYCKRMRELIGRMRGKMAWTAYLRVLNPFQT